jgi:formate dehydrogenase accessory protein FdhD
MVKVTEHGVKSGTSRETGVKDVSADGAEHVWSIPEETPVAFVYNQRNYAVMMATPDDLVDYAIGFSMSEQIIDHVDQIKSIDIQHSDKGVDYRIEIDRARLERLEIVQRRRNMVGSASCGLCGLENADSLFQKLPIVSEHRLKLEAASINRALAQLNDHQVLNQKTRTVHAAAFADLNGRIQLTREDVGRHNALDKLIGALAQQKLDIAGGFVVMTSRCSYELIEKSARFGIKAMVTVSAPTGFALAKAKEANMALYTSAPSGPVELIL